MRLEDGKLRTRAPQAEHFGVSWLAAAAAQHPLGARGQLYPALVTSLASHLGSLIMFVRPAFKSLADRKKGQDTSDLTEGELAG